MNDTNVEQKVREALAALQAEGFDLQMKLNENCRRQKLLRELLEPPDPAKATQGPEPPPPPPADPPKRRRRRKKEVIKIPPKKKQTEPAESEKKSTTGVRGFYIDAVVDALMSKSPHWMTSGGITDVINTQTEFAEAPVSNICTVLFRLRQGHVPVDGFQWEQDESTGRYLYRIKNGFDQTQKVG